MTRRLRLIPITLREAATFIDRYHRHLRSFRGGIFAIAAADAIEGQFEPWGVCIVGRPISRVRQADGRTVEITRNCTRPGSPKGTCSFLETHAKRGAHALGWIRVGTYTRADESGASMRGAGAQLVGEVKGRRWDTPSRPRERNGQEDVNKLLWEFPAAVPVEREVAE